MPQIEQICLKLYKHEIFLNLFGTKWEPHSTVGIIWKKFDSFIYILARTYLDLQKCPCWLSIRGKSFWELANISFRERFKLSIR
jgi:hypothetical protein